MKEGFKISKTVSKISFGKFKTWKGDECDIENPKISLEVKSEKKQEKKVETMHLMTVSCGRPNYQVIVTVWRQLFRTLTTLHQNQQELMVMSNDNSVTLNTDVTLDSSKVTAIW